MRLLDGTQIERLADGTLKVPAVPAPLIPFHGRGKPLESYKIRLPAEWQEEHTWVDHYTVENRGGAQRPPNARHEGIIEDTLLYGEGFFTGEIVLNDRDGSQTRYRAGYLYLLPDVHLTIPSGQHRRGGLCGAMHKHPNPRWPVDIRLFRVSKKQEGVIFDMDARSLRIPKNTLSVRGEARFDDHKRRAADTSQAERIEQEQGLARRVARMLGEHPRSPTCGRLPEMITGRRGGIPKGAVTIDWMASCMRDQHFGLGASMFEDKLVEHIEEFVLNYFREMRRRFPHAYQDMTRYWLWRKMGMTTMTFLMPTAARLCLEISNPKRWYTEATVRRVLSRAALPANLGRLGDGIFPPDENPDAGHFPVAKKIANTLKRRFS